jgi:glucose/mannose transport system substrate-binding protein
VVPFGIQALSKYEGHWVAVPINAHSINWLYLNAPLARRLGVTEPPDTWSDFMNLLIKAREAGVIPLAIGREPWEYSLLFEVIAAGVGGAEFYRRVFLELDPGALQGQLIEKIFRRMSSLREFIDPDADQRTWDEANGLVREGKALMQVHGSWAIGEFESHGLEPLKDYYCWRFPDTQGLFLLLADQYIFFKDANKDAGVADSLASMLMQPELQTELNLATGAIPARVDVSHRHFNICGQQAIKAMRMANLQRTLMGTATLSSIQPESLRDAIFNLVLEHFQGWLTDEEAIAQLRAIIGGR